MRNILKVIFGRVLFTVLCLLIQLVWLIGLVWKLNQYYVWFSAVFDIIALIVVLRINAKSDFSAARLVWTIVILALPVFGICLYPVSYTHLDVYKRQELARVRPDGSTVLAYTQEAVDKLNPEDMFASISADTNGSIMPGWEPERMEKIKDLFAMYENIDDEKLFANLKYFLERIMPTCDKYDINMAIHPDDPAWSVFGLPRIIINKENILRMMKMVDNPHNGVTFCSGSYGTNLNNDLPDMIRSLKGRIHFAHVRNLKFNSPTDFEESAHLSSDGTFDMYEIMLALYDIGFEGPIRPCLLYTSRCV